MWIFWVIVKWYCTGVYPLLLYTIPYFYPLLPAGGSANGELHTDAVRCRVWAASLHRTQRPCLISEVLCATKGLYVTHGYCFCCINGWQKRWVSMPAWPLVLTSFHHTGHTIVFTDQSGMNASGHVMLGTMDVHHQWIKVKCVYICFISIDCAKIL